MTETVRKLAHLLRVPAHRRIATGLAVLYGVAFLVAIRDITVGGEGLGVTLADAGLMFERTGPMTFEAVARITLPGVTVLLAPVNLLLAAVLSGLVGLNLLVTYLAFRQPRACSFNRSTGILASVPALLAGGACCAPTIGRTRCSLRRDRRRSRKPGPPRLSTLMSVDVPGETPGVDIRGDARR